MAQSSLDGIQDTVQQPPSPCFALQKATLSFYLSGAGMGIDGDLAGASSVAINRGGHFAPGDEGLYLLLGGDKLSAFGSLQ